MIVFLTILHVVVSLFLIIVVLLQSGKAADLAGAFGGMGSQTAFGPRGAATVLSKATTISAVLFMLTSISLGIMQGNRAGVSQSVIEKTGVAPTETVTPNNLPPGAVMEQIPVAPQGESGAGGLEATPNVEVLPENPSSPQN